MERIPSQPWAQPAEAVTAYLDVDPVQGLGSLQVRERRRRHGRNLLARFARRSALRILAEQLASLITALLLCASVLAFMFGDRAEAIAILAVIIINSSLGFLTELHAVRSMEALRALGQVPAVVRRNGRLLKINAEELVPGDVLVIEGGDVVSADARLLSGSRLQVDESLLTGESEPVDKSPEPLDAGTHLSERRNMLHKGSAVTRGSAEAVVTATGIHTEVGTIAGLAAGAAPGSTPLEKSLQRLAHRLVFLTAAVCALLAIAGLLAGRDLALTLETAIALAVAAIPEGLPIVATMALARGMWRMARNKALIERLSAVATLGATNLIMADKTGTLTANRMTVRRVMTADGDYLIEQSSPDPGLVRLMEVAVLCNSAEISVPAEGARAVGDPTEIALLSAARDLGIDPGCLRERHPRLHQVAFDSESKMMATVHSVQHRLMYCIKGAPEQVLDNCNSVWTKGSPQHLDAGQRERWLQQAEEFGDAGLRTLAFAFKHEELEDKHPYHDLTLLGIAGLADPPQAGIGEDMHACHRAGIRVAMVTGDHLATARAIAGEIGLCPQGKPCICVDARSLGADTAEDFERLLDADVIARASPGLKLQLIGMHQARGKVVAMTGDGVNDAPALKKADIGIAMGLRGTQVAREAAAMVLEDDEFSTIIKAVAQGRVIYANIRKFVTYLMSCNLSEILVIGLATLAGAAPPLLPLQILFLNLVTDVFPALALGMCGAQAGNMDQPPRPRKEPLITRERWLRISIQALVLSVTVLASVGISYSVPGGPGHADATTTAFLVLALGQVWHVFNMRSHNSPILRNEVTRNPWVWAAVLLCLVMLGLALALDPLRHLLRLSLPDGTQWGLIVAASLVPLFLGPAAARLLPRRPGSAVPKGR